MKEAPISDSREPKINRGWRRLVAIALIVLGGGTMALVGSYYLYGVIATSKLDQLVYPSPVDKPTPSQPTQKLVSNIDPSLLSVYPGIYLNPKYWNEPLWAGTDPVPPTNLPEGFEPVDLSTITAELHTLGEAFNIQIPSIEVASTVKELEILDMGDSRAYETPKNTVGHIPETGNPGEYARGWFFGHLESPIRGEGNVFKDLPKIPGLLREGNRVFIMLENEDNTFLYEAYATEVVHESKLVVDKEQDTTITLVACVPKLTYDYRLLVNAKLVGIKSQG